MSTLPIGNYIFDLSIEFTEDQSGVDATAFGQRVQALVVEELAPATVLAPRILLNPAVQVYRMTTSGMVAGSFTTRRYRLLARLAVITRGLDRSAFSNLLARAFREAGAGSEVDAAELGRFIDQGRAEQPGFFSGRFGRVSLEATRVTSLPSTIDPPSLPTGFGPFYDTRGAASSARQGEVVAVPDPILPGSGGAHPADDPEHPAVIPEEHPATTQPPGGGGSMSVLSMVTWGLLLATLAGGAAAVAVAYLHPTPPPPPPDPRRRTR